MLTAWMLLLLLLLLLYIPSGSRLVKLHSFDVPGSVEEGADAVLGCDYGYNITEGAELDVKWYFDGSPSPFMLWVPHQRRAPQVISDTFRSHVDLGHTVGSDPYRLYSSVRLKKVGRALSGSYTCKVSSFSTEESRTKRMTVYGEQQDFLKDSRVLK